MIRDENMSFLQKRSIIQYNFILMLLVLTILYSLLQGISLNCSYMSHK